MVSDGYIPTIHDPVIGNGGFILNSIKYLHERYPGINWEINKLNISGYEIDSNIHMSTLQCLYNYTNFDFSNTIINYDCIKMYNPMRYDIIMADPCIMNHRNTHYHNQCRHNVIHTEISFIKYVMNMLNIDGRAAIIIKDRCLTSNKKKYIKIRRKLLSNFNLHHVVSINLSNMGDRYSILFFDNTGPTDNIDFYSLTEDDYKLIETFDNTITHEQIAFNYYHINNYKKHVYIDNIIIDSGSDTSESSTTTNYDMISIHSITSEDDETLLSNTIDLLKL
jgi:hypothetical protein